jgi:hypothetical protein
MGSEAVVVVHHPLRQELDQVVDGSAAVVVVAVAFEVVAGKGARLRVHLRQGPGSQDFPLADHHQQQARAQGPC